MEEKTVQMICPNCQNRFYVRVTSPNQGLVCPFCNFQGYIKTQALGQPTQPTTAYIPPSSKRTKNYLIPILAIVFIIILILAGTFYFLGDDSSPKEQEGGEMEIIRVWHEPDFPDTDDEVHFYAEIVNCPSSYDILFNISVYEGDSLKMYMKGWMQKKSGDIYERIEDFTDTSYDSGREVRFWVEIYDVEYIYLENRDTPPILTSETDIFIIS